MPMSRRLAEKKAKLIRAREACLQAASSPRAEKPFTIVDGNHRISAIRAMGIEPSDTPDEGGHD